MTWIKVEAATPTKPEILRLARIMGVTADDAFGKAMRFWLWLDGITVDGRVDGLASQDVDAVVGACGICNALVAVGWLQVDESNERLTVPNFDRHNGESAKARALRTRRQAKWRRAAVDGHVDGAASTSASTSASTREEKRREESKESTNVDSSASSSRTPPAGSGFVFATLSGQWELPARKLDDYQATYADRLDVAAEMRKAKQWLADNKSRRKTARGMKSFLTGWLNRAYDRSPLTMDGSRVAAKPSEDSVYNPETGEFVKPLGGKS